MHVGPYQVLQELGQGGMARVFLGHDPRSGTRVAIKVLLEANRSAPAYQTRFLREARALGKVEHPNVARLLDLGEHQGTLYIALAYYSQGSLADKLSRGGPLPIADALELGRQLASGLAAAHAQGVLHRDLKPDNVLFGEGRALLSDFGLAKDLGREGQTQDLTKSGTLQGTPGYWAPEQARGIASGVGPWTDVYGLGAILYAALSGQAPIVGEGLIAILEATETQRPRPLRAFRDDVPRDLEAVVMRCLEKEPGARYSSARELEEALAGLSARPKPSSSRAPILALAAVGLLLGAGLAGLHLASSQAPPATPTLPASASSPERSRPAPSPLAASAEEIYLRGRARFEQGDFTRAFELFQRAAREDHPQAVNAVGLLRSTGQGCNLDISAAAESFQRAFDLGYAQAGLNLALIHSRGQGAVVDKARARAILSRARELDPKHVEVAFNLGVMLYEGHGGPRDRARAVPLIQEGAEGGVPRAMRYLAHAYGKGLGVPRNEALAREWLERGAAIGDQECQFTLAVACQSGEGRAKDSSQAFHWMQKAADQGHLRAAFSLGLFYEKGFGTPKDEAAALRWYRLSAERGAGPAMHNLAIMIKQGRGGATQDLALAMSWYARAADNGVPGSMLYLGLAYLKGEGVPKDLTAGVEWLERAADKGLEEAMFNLGIVFQTEPELRDPTRAFSLFERAAGLGHVHAMHNLAIMLDEGRAVPRDAARALDLFRRAAEGGDAKAMVSMGRKLVFGDGVAKDRAAGKQWLERAAQSKDPIAREEARMTLSNLPR